MKQLLIMYSEDVGKDPLRAVFVLCFAWIGDTAVK